MPFSKMDPSCTIGFYSRGVQDYERITQELSKVGEQYDDSKIFYISIIMIPY